MIWDFIGLLFLPIFLGLFVAVAFLQHKFKRRLLEKEKDFCKSILLTESVLTDSPKSSWNLVKLIMFKVNIEKISDDVVIAMVTKLRIFYFLYLISFISVVSFFICKFLEGK